MLRPAADLRNANHRAARGKRPSTTSFLLRHRELEPLAQEWRAILKPQLTRFENGITACDAEYVRPGMAAAHIIAHGGRAAFVDTGTTHAVSHLLAALGELGIDRAAVDFVF